MHLRLGILVMALAGLTACGSNSARTAEARTPARPMVTAPSSVTYSVGLTGL